jgi:hypothetical protein
MRTKHSGDEGEISDRTLRKLKMDLGPHLERTLDLIHADNISHSAQSNMPNQISNIRRRFKELEEKDKGYDEVFTARQSQYTFSGNDNKGGKPKGAKNPDTQQYFEDNNKSKK